MYFNHFVDSHNTFLKTLSQYFSCVFTGSMIQILVINSLNVRLVISTSVLHCSVMFFCITLSYYVGVVIILSQDTKQPMSTNILRYTLTTLIDYLIFISFRRKVLKKNMQENGLILKLKYLDYFLKIILISVCEIFPLLIFSHSLRQTRGL